MKIFFILMLLTYSLIAQNSIPATQKINNIFKIQSNKLFYVQVGAFKNRRYALVVQKNLKKMNYPLKIEERRVEMESYFKLLIGPFKSKKEAYSTKNSLPIKYRDSFILTDNN